MVELDPLLQSLVLKGGSDLHLKVGEPPVMRIHGDLTRNDAPPLTQEEVEHLVNTVLNDDRKALFAKRLDIDLSYSTDFARFRVNVFRQQDFTGAVFRVIPFTIKTLDELMVPPVVKDLAMKTRGLLLVTGPTGSGKSTTLAAAIDFINTHKQVNIVTIEDPIEFIHEDKGSSINQREVGEDTHSFAAALKHVMRQNPDVILVGEMRDLETIQLAVTAAETGHLVLSTVHTTDAAQTIDRIVDVFPPEQQRQIRTQLSLTLNGILSQTLLPRADVPGRAAAFEVLVVTPAIRSLIRDGKTHQVAGDIQTGSQYGMQTLDSSLLELVRAKVVRFEDALAKSSNPREFEQRAAAFRDTSPAPAQGANQPMP